MRLTDVESLTSLQLLTGVGDEQVRVMLATNLTVGLWQRLSWMDLTDEQLVLDEPDCPPG